MAGDPQMRGNLLKSLMVVTVYSYDRVAQHLPHPCPLIDLYLVDQRMAQIPRIIMIQTPGKLVGKMSIQGATQSDVDQLTPTANSKKGLSVRDSPMEQIQFK